MKIFRNLSIALSLVAMPALASAKTAAPAAPATAAAKAKPARLPKSLRAFDTNQDGRLEKSELAAMRVARIEARFDKLDSNHDGMISKDEYVAAMQPKAKAVRVHKSKTKVVKTVKATKHARRPGKKSIKAPRSA